MRVLAAIIAALCVLNNTNQLGVKAVANALRRASPICTSKVWMVSCSSTKGNQVTRDATTKQPPTT